MAIGENVVLYCQVTDGNDTTVALTGDSRILVRYYSSAVCSMDAESLHPIDESLYIIRNGNKTEFGNSATFDQVENPIFTFSAANSAGFVGSETIEAPMVNYVKLSGNIENGKPDASGNMTLRCSGYWFNGSFGKVTNTLKAWCRYSCDGNFSDQIAMTIYSVGNSYTATASFKIDNFNYKKTYQFECDVADELDYVTTQPYLAKSLPAFHWSEDDFQFEVPVYFNDGAFVDGKPLPTSGTWTPTLYSSAVSYYTSQRGWYSKAGNAVTVGFYIKAYCNSGYDSSQIYIYGLPYTPSFSAAGGGMCSGAYVGAGFTFQCFVAESSGSITTRVQACNNTSATNLTTSASGCNYRSGGGEITLSGTITYITS